MRNNTNTFKHLLALVLTIAALTAGHVSSWATGTFTVENSGNTFTITRSGNTTVIETVTYRLVSLSAIAGTHFTSITESLYFNNERNSINVTVTEFPNGSSEYYYQNGTTRKYRLEVLDKDGSVLASCDRDMTTGTSISSTAFDVKDLTIQSSEFTANDDGYDANGYKSVASTGYFNSAAPKVWLQAINAELRMNLSLDAKENDDGYQYLQFLVDNTTSCDNRSGCNNGDPGNISLSKYMAGFEIKSGSKDAEYKSYTFPITSVGNNAGASDPWGYGTNYPLDMQKFNSNRASDGRIILPTDFSTLVIRLNASGSSGSDEWAAKNVVAHIQAVDATAPTVLDNYRVSGGRHQKENTFYVSVPFSEIVTVSGTPTLTTSWGTLSYVAGSGSNVLTFSSSISKYASGTLIVTGYSGTIRDLAGNAFSGTISKDFGTALDADYAWSLADFNSMGSNTYEIATKTDLRHLALMVNGNYDLGSKKTFRQTNDIVCDDTYIPIGVYSSLVVSQQRPFFGTYDGQGYTISGITVNRTGNVDADNYIGLFGYIGGGSTVQNVVLAGSTFKGHNHVGGIAGYNQRGTISNCRVESSVSVMAGSPGAGNHGGIAGTSYNATIIGCASAAVVSNDGYNNCIYYGGIVGILQEYSALSNCLYTGSTVIGNSKTGPIVGETSKSTLTNNYYTDSSFGDGMYGARHARTVTLGTGITLSGTETTYDLSGITAIGNSAISYGGTIYSGAGQTLTLGYSGEVPEGYKATYSVNDMPIDGNTFTMPAGDVTVSVSSTPDFATYWHADADHDGTTAECAYIITTTTGLDLLATMVNSGTDYNGKFFKLGADITYTYNKAWNDAESTEENYTAIGCFRSNKNYPFNGTFDGDGHTVSGIRIYKTGTGDANRYQGLFGMVGTYGTVKNVTLADARITGYSSVGSIAGNNGGAIENCHAAATVAIAAKAYYPSNYHGGIVGNNNSNGIVSGCTSAATLTANNVNSLYYGGIAGQNVGTIRNCLAVGASIPVLNEYYGVITGYNNGGTLRNNYYTACTVAGVANATGKGCQNADVTENDGAVCAAAYSYKPAEIGSETASYPGGITVYEHGLAWQGKYYVASGTAVSTTLTLASGTKDGVTAWWGTFYDGTTGRTLPAGAAAYTLGSDYRLYRLGDDGHTIPADVAVVVLAESGTVALTLTPDASADDHTPGGNILRGSDTPVDVAGLGGVPYVLGTVGSDPATLGFYQFTGPTIPGGKAYYVVVTP